MLVDVQSLQMIKLPGAGQKGGCSDWCIKQTGSGSTDTDQMRWVLDSTSQDKNVKARYLDVLLTSKHAVPLDREAADEIVRCLERKFSCVYTVDTLAACIS